jgi:transcriptional regulator GlxA family with amidase domain
MFSSITGGTITASNGLAVETTPLASFLQNPVDIVIVSSSWAPELHSSAALQSALRRWARAGVTLGGLDTGAFILAKAGLLSGRRATVHYEHLDALKELHPEINASDQLFVFDEKRITCCGGESATDFALHIVRQARGDSLANAAARYLFHERLRPIGTRQEPGPVEPLGSMVPSVLRAAIRVMGANLETSLSIPAVCRAAGISQRQLDRLFMRFVGSTPAVYYRDLRLDRARGLVTQTDMPLSEVAVACGFSSQVHFSRTYRERFGISPRTDRVEGRIPFEFRARPLHHPSKNAVASPVTKVRSPPEGRKKSKSRRNMHK